MSCIRRSERIVKSKRSYSPEPVNIHKKTGSKKSQNPSTGVDGLDKNEKSVCCDYCKSSFIVNTSRKVKRKSRLQSFPIHQIDPVSNQVVSICKTCGVSLSSKRKTRREKTVPSVSEKEKYLKEAQTFANSLVEVLQDSDAKRLFCPEFKKTPCACLQKFVLSNGNMEDSQKRAILLLQLLKEAKRLSQLKWYTLDQPLLFNGKGIIKNIGLGNGQKRSQEFEMFVMEERRYLRDELHLCERATQRVLMYSNNFLHKRLKTEPQRGRRLIRKKGKNALGLLKPVTEMTTETCCVDNCVLMARTHSALLHQWRERAASGQAEARRVLAEMLTPCGGGRSNCFRFVSIVTGCSHNTISKVNEQMERTGGEREPPEHGLKKWWQDQAKQVGKKQPGSLYHANSLDLDGVCNTGISLATQVDDSLIADALLDLPLRSRDQMTELQSHVMALQEESLLDDPMFPLNTNNNSQVILKVNDSNPRLHRQSKNPSLLTDDSDEMPHGSELSPNLFLSPTTFISNENCQAKVLENSSTNNQQVVSNMALGDDMASENLLSSGMVINIMQSFKGTEGRQSSIIDESGCSLINGNTCNSFLSNVPYNTQKDSSTQANL